MNLPDDLARLRADMSMAGLVVEAVEGESEARPRPTPMFLAIRAIRAALDIPAGKR